MKSPHPVRLLAAALLVLLWAGDAFAGERITLRSGFEVDCVRREVAGDKVRLYLRGVAGESGDGNYMEVAADAIVRAETIPDPPPAPAAQPVAPASLARATGARPAQPTPAELHEMLARAGAAHRIDADLLASVVHAESGGQAAVVSHAGARGLMQLMPATALALGVRDAFVAEQNVEGGTRYLDQMLERYNDNLALALAAYNAGPGAVDRYHGVPPFRETRAYVTRIIREFNRRKLGGGAAAIATHAGAAIAPTPGSESR